VRLAFGTLALLWTLSLARDLGAFFSRAGVLGSEAPRWPAWEWSLLWLADSDLAIGALYQRGKGGRAPRGLSRDPHHRRATSQNSYTTSRDLTSMCGLDSGMFGSSATGRVN
jgi:hypothetical protein